MNTTEAIEAATVALHTWECGCEWGHGNPATARAHGEGCWWSWEGTCESGWPHRRADAILSTLHEKGQGTQR